MKRLKRIGRAKYKYEFEVNVCDVRGVPASVSSVAVVWQRSDQRLSTPPAVVEVADRVANFGAKLTNVCTLYGGAKDTFEPKMSSVKIVDYGASGRAAVVAQARERHEGAMAAERSVFGSLTRSWLAEDGEAHAERESAALNWQRRCSERFSTQLAATWCRQRVHHANLCRETQRARNLAFEQRRAKRLAAVKDLEQKLSAEKAESDAGMARALSALRDEVGRFGEQMHEGAQAALDRGEAAHDEVEDGAGEEEGEDAELLVRVGHVARRPRSHSHRAQVGARPRARSACRRELSTPRRRRGPCSSRPTCRSARCADGGCATC